MKSKQMGISACPHCDVKYTIPMKYRGKDVSCKKCGGHFTVVFRNQGTVEKEQVQETREHPGTKREEYPVIYKLILNYRLCSEARVMGALSELNEKSLNGPRQLPGEVIVNKALINESQFKTLLSIQRYLKISHLDHKFGEMAIENGILSRQEIDEALQEQKKFFQEKKTLHTLGDILVMKKRMTEEQRDRILEDQCRIRSINVKEEGEDKLDESSNERDIVGELFTLTLSQDKLRAEIRLVEEVVPDDVTVEKIKKFLESKGIGHGVKSDLLIEEYLNEASNKDEPWIIAEGTPPREGRNAQVRYFFDRDPLKAGKLREDGSIDFNERQVIPQVDKGGIIAEKNPSVKGEDGISIHGTPVPAQEVVDVIVQRGQGVKVSDDGLKFFADLDGMPSLSKEGVLTVSPLYDIDGDVGIKTGNIDFDGAVRVAGSVEKGFYVKCHSLTAHDIEEARIEAEGDVAVFNGMIGSKVIAGGNVSAKYIRRTNINTSGNVVAEREIIDSDIKTTGTCVVERGHILYSSIIAKNGVHAVRIGSEKIRPSNLIVGIDYKVKKTIEDLRNQIMARGKGKGKLKSHIERLKEEYERLDEEIVVLAQEQDKIIRAQLALKKQEEEVEETEDPGQTERLKEAIDQIEVKVSQLNEKVEGLIEKQGAVSDEIEESTNELQETRNALESISDEISRLTEELKNDAGKPVVKVSETIFSGTLIEGPRSSYKLNEDFTRVAIAELKIDDPDSTPKWEMKITPLK